MKKLLRILWKVLLSAAILYALCRQVDWRAFSETAQGFSAIVYSLAFLTYCLGMLIRSWKLRMSLRMFQLELGLRKVVRISYGSLPFTLLLPSGLGEDICKGVLINESEHNLKKVALALAFDKVTNLFALLLLAVTGLLIVYLLEGYLVTAIPLALFAASVAGLLLLALAIRTDAMGLLPAGHREMLHRFAGHIKANAARSVTNVALGMLMHFVMTISVYYLIHASFSDVRTAFVYFMAFIPMIICFQSVPVFFGGVGAREVGFVYLFGLIGVAEEAILLVPLSYYGIYALNVLTGLIVFLASRSAQQNGKVPVDEPQAPRGTA